MTHQLRFFAAAADAAGTEEATAEATTVEDLRVELGDAYGAEFTSVLAQCSLLVNGRRMDAGKLPENARVDVLPPFAGG